MASVDGVVDVHDLHVWTITSGFPALSAHVLVRPGADCHAIRRELEVLLHERFELTHTTLQVEHAPGLVQVSLVKLAAVTLRGARPRSSPAPRAASAPRPARALAGRGRAGRRRRAPRREVDADVALELDVTDPASCEAFVARGAPSSAASTSSSTPPGSRLGRDPVRRVDRGGRADGARDERQRPHPDDAPLPAAPRARRATSSTSARSPAAGRTRTARPTSPRSSPCAASRARCARTCSAGRSASRPSRRASSRRSSRRVRFRGDEDKANSVYDGRRARRADRARRTSPTASSSRSRGRRTSSSTRSS